MHVTSDFRDMRSVSNVEFEEAWSERVRAPYGDIEVNWIGLEALVKSKSGTSTARHDEDVRVLGAQAEQGAREALS